MSQIFNPENPFFSAVSKIISMIFLDLMWLLLCVPIITAGASTTAFYYTVQKTIWHERGYVWTSFFESFRSNFKQATKIWLVFLVVFLICFGDVAALQTLAQAGRIASGYHYFFYVLMVLIGAYAIWTFAYLARFHDRSRVVMKNAAVFMIGHLPTTLLILLLIAGAAFVVWLIPVTFLLMPAVALWLSSAAMEKCFRKAMTDEVKAEEDERNMEFHDDYSKEEVARKKRQEEATAQAAAALAADKDKDIKDADDHRQGGDSEDSKAWKEAAAALEKAAAGSAETKTQEQEADSKKWQNGRFV